MNKVDKGPRSQHPTPNTPKNGTSRLKRDPKGALAKSVKYTYLSSLKPLQGRTMCGNQIANDAHQKKAQSVTFPTVYDTWLNLPTLFSKKN